MKKQASQKKNKSGSSGKGRSLSSRFLIFTLIFALLANTYMIRKVFFTSKAACCKSESSAGQGENAGWVPSGTGKEAGSESEEGKIIRAANVSERWGLTDPVTGKEVCQQAVRDLGPEIGIDVVRYDYTCIRLDHHHLMDSYTLQQCYRGIPVLGHVLTVAVEKDGRIRSIIGREARLPDSIDALIDSAMSEKEAEAIWLKDLARTGDQALAEDEALRKSEGLRIVCNGKNDPGLVYCFRKKQKETKESVGYQIDAISGKIRSFDSIYDSAMTHVTLQGQSGEKKLAVDQIASSRILIRDQNRHIGIYAVGRDKEEIAVNPSRKSDAADPLKQAGVDALYNMQRAWQYFARVHGRKGLADGDGQLKIYLETDSGERDDQAFFVTNPDGGYYILIGDRKAYDRRTSAWLDLMGHEYSHGIIRQAWKKEFGMNYPLENDVLTEGLADLFGELVEDSYDGKGKDSYYDNSCDWVSAGFSSDPRDAKKALESKPSSYSDMASLKDPHDGSYLVTHPAWLLTQGVEGKEEGKWNNLRLSQLYYDALWSVNGLSDLADFRFALENSARALCESGRIEPAQMEAVAKALDQVAIPKEAEDSPLIQNQEEEKRSASPDICLTLEGTGPDKGDAGKRALLSYAGSLIENQPKARIHVLDLNSDRRWNQQNGDYSLAAVNRAILGLEGVKKDSGSDLEGLLSSASDCLSSGENKKEKNQGSQLVILWKGKGHESVSDKAISMARSLKDRGTEILCLDLTEEGGADKSGLAEIASKASYYPASAPDAPTLILSWLLYRQAHPGSICRMTVKGPETMTVYEKGKEVFSYGPTSTDVEASPIGLVWKSGQGSEAGESLVLEYWRGSGLEVRLEGGEKLGDLTFLYQNSRGDFSEKKEFEDISLEEKTVLYTGLDQGKAGSLEIDEDGDGLFDRMEKAGRNKKAGTMGHPVTGPVAILALCMLALLLLVSLGPVLIKRILSRRKEKTGGPVCLHCGMKNRRGARACRQCGKLLPAPLEGHESKFSRDREKAGFKPARLIFAAILLLLTLAHVIFCRQPGVMTYLDFAEGRPAAGSYVCEQGLEGKDTQKKICRHLLSRFVGRLEKDDQADPALVENMKEALNQLEK